MRHTMAWLVIVAGAAVLLAGCSGSGAPPAEVRGASVQTLASDQVSAAMLFAAWSGMLYVQTAGQASVPVRTNMPDGSLRFTGTNSDGSVYQYFVLHPFVESSPGRGTITWPDGTTYRTEWEAAVWENGGNRSVDHLRDTFPNGASMECQIVANYAAHVQSLWEGTARAATGRTMQFHLDRLQEERDQLTLNLPDGATMQIEVPLTGVFGAAYWPRFADGATGTYKAAGGPALQISLAGTDRWTQWKLTAPDGTTGAFALDANMLGQGQLTRAGQTLAALGWDAEWLGTLGLLGAGQQQVAPSAAARDFQINRWVGNAAAMGPMPMY
jgi:hypothetical protein